MFENLIKSEKLGKTKKCNTIQFNFPFFWEGGMAIEVKIQLF